MRDWITLNPHPGLSGKPLMRAIVADVAAEHCVAVDGIMSHCRIGPVAAARLAAYYRIRTTGRFSYSQIGDFFDRDYSTVITGVKRHTAHLAVLAGLAPEPHREPVKRPQDGSREARNARIVALSAQRLTRAQIAARMGITRGTVAGVLNRYAAALAQQEAA